MLSDQEVDALARAHLETRPYRDKVALVKVFDLDDPPGVYYGERLIDPSDGILLGGGGFFVHRKDGSIRSFGSGELVWASERQKPGSLLAPEVTPSVIQFLLTHATEDSPFLPPHGWGAA